MFSLALNQAFVEFLESVDMFSCNVHQMLKAFLNYIENHESIITFLDSLNFWYQKRIEKDLKRRHSVVSDISEVCIATQEILSKGIKHTIQNFQK